MELSQQLARCGDFTSTASERLFWQQEFMEILQQASGTTQGPESTFPHGLSVSSSPKSSLFGSFEVYPQHMQPKKNQVNLTYRLSNVRHVYSHRESYRATLDTTADKKHANTHEPGTFLELRLTWYVRVENYPNTFAYLNDQKQLYTVGQQKKESKPRSSPP